MDPVGIRVWIQEPVGNYYPNPHQVQVSHIYGVWSGASPWLEDWSTAANIATSLSYALRQAEIPQYYAVTIQDVKILNIATEFAFENGESLYYDDPPPFGDHDGSYYMYYDDLQYLMNLATDQATEVKLDFGLAWSAIQALEELLTVAENIEDATPTPYEIHNCMREFQGQGMEVQFELGPNYKNYSVGLASEDNETLNRTAYWISYENRFLGSANTLNEAYQKIIEHKASVVIT